MEVIAGTNPNDGTDVPADNDNDGVSDVIDLDDGVIVEIIESTPRTIKQMKITYIAR